MELKQKIIIAIDGFSSCGKSTFAKRIASELSYIFIDTGAMYRATTLYAIESNLNHNKQVVPEKLIPELKNISIHFERNAGRLTTFLNGKDVEREIRGQKVSDMVSEVSKIKEVREYLVALQQKMGEKKGIVMDGRDIGTVVFPNAEIKVYMTASPDVRAKRRFDELTEKGEIVSYDEIKKNVEERDYKDMNRKESPLKKADDALELDNSHMTVEEQFTWFTDVLKSKGYLQI